MVRTSINIKYDTSDKDLVSGYYATSSHSELISNVLKSVQGKNIQNSIIAYGPYGAGKSYVASLLLGLTSNSLTKSDTGLLKKKFSTVDDEITQVLDEQIVKKQKIITVTITGSEGDFKTTLLNSINRSLNNSKVKVNLPGKSSEIIKTINRWEENYENTYTEFLFELSDNDYTISKFIEEIQKGNKSCFDLFEQIYTKLTAGSKYYANYDSKTDEVLYTVCKQLAKKKYHLLIVWDEFGRVLQNLHLSDINNFMQEIQDLAELANNGIKNLTTLFIAHKPLGFYLNFATKELRDEFAKVEKRFRVLEIKSDYVTFLQITSEVLRRKKITSLVNDEDIQLLRKYNVFSSYLNDTELVNLIGKGSYPLHPITLFALPKLSSIFGQNERTLFSFLYDESSNGLLGFLNHSEGYYYVDRLVDFFFSNIEKSYIEEVDLYNIYSSNINKIPVLINDDVADTKRVYKFAMIWRLINGNHILKLSSNLISYSLGLDILKVEQILSKLNEKKLVRYNTLHSEWEIFKGSNLDLDKEVKKVLLKIPVKSSDLIVLFNNKNPYKYVYSNQHNAINEITRFGLMMLNPKDTNGFPSCDIKIELHFGDINLDEYNEDKLYAKLNYNFNDIKQLLTNIYVIEYIQENEYYKREYSGLDVDVEYKLSVLEKELNKYYQKIFDSEFKYNNERLKITDIEELNNFLDELFNTKFNKYPMIINDQINMFKVSSVQYRSFVKVLDNILNNPNSLNKIYSGSSPADLIYKSVIENINLIGKNDKIIKKIKKNVLQYLKKHPNGKVIDIMRILQVEPYGVRPYVAILLTFKLIRKEWNDMLIFISDTYVPNISTSDLMDYLNNYPDILKYSFSIFDSDNREYLESLEKIFSSDNELVSNKSLSVRVCSNMYEWYIGLPIVSQQGVNMSISNIAFMNVIKSSRSNPKLAIEQLMKDFDLMDIKIFKSNITEHFNNFVSRFKKSITNKIGTKNLNEWALSQDEAVKKANRLVNGITKGKSIFDIYYDDTDNLEISKWTNSSFNMLKNLVIEDFKKINDDLEVDTVTINGKEKFVQKVELSTKASVTYKNIINLINATSQYLTDSEVEKIVLILVDKYIS